MSFELDRAGIRVFGDVAITHYFVTIRETDEGEAIRITHTWIRDGADWRILGGTRSTVPGANR